jgi:hypothetical protein
MTELTDHHKEQILNDILNSTDFHDSKRYQDLLKYLVEKSEKDGSIKEIEIAIDVFDKDSSFDPNTNPLIRSYISNLRKKLEHYYLTTENQYAYKITIPKGQYLVNYIPVNNNNGFKGLFKYKNIIYLSIIFLLLICIGYLIIIAPKSSRISLANSMVPNSIWKGYIQKSDQPTIIVLGDYLFMIKKNSGGDRIFVRNTKINNDKDFQEYIKKYPELYGQYEKLNFTYLRPSSSFGLLEIIKALGSSEDNVSIRLASQLKWEDLEKHNIIFLGTFKTLYKLDTLIGKTNLRFNVEPSSLKIMNSKSDTIQSFNVSWVASNYQDDYSALLKLPGTGNNTILFCLGFSEIGVMDAVNSAVDPNLISRIQKFTGKDYTKLPSFFELVSRCEGIELTSFSSEIKYFNTYPASDSN